MTRGRSSASGPLYRAWRAEVLALRDDHRTRVFPAMLCVGTPGGVRVSVPADLVGDHDVRVDVVAALLQRHRREQAAGPPAVWLRRPGQPSWHDLDAAWLPAAIHAAAEAGLPPVFVVVTRTGWYDPQTGAGRTWRRLRHRSGPRAGPARPGAG